MLASNREALDLLALGIERARLSPGEDVAIAVDVAATQLIEPSGAYRLEAERRSLSVDELVEELVGWAATYPIVSLDDPLAEDDWEGWRTAGARLGGVPASRRRPVRHEPLSARARDSLSCSERSAG